MPFIDLKASILLVSDHIIFKDFNNFERASVIKEYFLFLWKFRVTSLVHLKAETVRGVIVKVNMEQYRFPSRIISSKGKL